MSDFLRAPCAEWVGQLVKPIKNLSFLEYQALYEHLDTCTACALARMDFQMIERMLQELPAPEYSSESSGALPARLEQFWNEEQEKAEQACSTTPQIASLSLLTASADETASVWENSCMLPLNEHNALTASAGDMFILKEENSGSTPEQTEEEEEHKEKPCPLAKCEDEDDATEPLQVLLSAFLWWSFDCPLHGNEIRSQVNLEEPIPPDYEDILLACLRQIIGEDASSAECRRFLHALLEIYEQAKGSDPTEQWSDIRWTSDLCHQWHAECKRAFEDAKEHLPYVGKLAPRLQPKR